VSRRASWIVGVGLLLVLLLALGWQAARRSREAPPLALRPEHTSPALPPTGTVPPRAMPQAAAQAPPGTAPRSTRGTTASPSAIDPAPPQETRYPATPALPPDDAVGEIRRLLGRGERPEALRQLRALRRRHPRYDVPQDLLDLHP
jgi:hypothetical protein